MKGGSYTGYLVLITALVTYLAMLKRTKTILVQKFILKTIKLLQPRMLMIHYLMILNHYLKTNLKISQKICSIIPQL